MAWGVILAAQKVCQSREAKSAGMVAYDLLMVGVVVLMTLYGSWKGMAWQLASLSAVFVSYLVAYRFRTPVSEMIDASHSYYSVISPEGCAGILWKSHAHAEDAANALRFTSKNLPDLGVVDTVISEPLGGAHRDHHSMAAQLKLFLSKTLRELADTPSGELVQRRYEKFRHMGVFFEGASLTAPESFSAAGQGIS